MNNPATPPAQESGKTDLDAAFERQARKPIELVRHDAPVLTGNDLSAATGFDPVALAIACLNDAYSYVKDGGGDTDALDSALAQLRASQPSALQAASEPKPIEDQLARWAIDGAILKGRTGEAGPPSADHWLHEYWSIGQQLAKLGETSPWDNVTPADAPAAVLQISFPTIDLSKLPRYLESAGVGLYEHINGKLVKFADLEALVSEPAAVLPFVILGDEMAALRRFHECALDGSSYDVSKEMMKRLAEIGLLRRTTGSIYEHTTFGLAVLKGGPDGGQ